MTRYGFLFHEDMLHPILAIDPLLLGQMIRPDKVWRVIGGALSDMSMDPDDCGWFCYFVVSVVAKYELGGFSWLGQEVGEFLKAGCGMSRAQQFNPCL